MELDPVVLVNEIRTTWIKTGTVTVAGGISYIKPDHKACATDYGDKVRVFYERNIKYDSKEITPIPSQFNKEIVITP